MADWAALFLYIDSYKTRKHKLSNVKCLSDVSDCSSGMVSSTLLVFFAVVKVNSKQCRKNHKKIVQIALLLLIKSALMKSGQKAVQ